jgi:hypothetical protein
MSANATPGPDRLVVRATRNPLTEPELLDMVRRYKAGETTYEIAARVGCSRQTVLYWIDKLGVPRRPPIRSLAPEALERLRAEVAEL